jgi:ATP-dependent helicase/nuclease subunit B
MLTHMQMDDAGQNLLEVLKDLSLMNQVKISSSSWFSLLDLSIEQGSFIESSKKGLINVFILPLSAAELRKFDAVLIIGCDDQHLPSNKTDELIFSSALIRELGLPNVEEDFQQQANELSQLIMSHDYVDFYWQSYQQAGKKIVNPHG